MSLFSRDPILLTPGPLTTSLATKTAMLRDWGSWDAGFNAVTARVRRKLLEVVHGEGTHECVPLQGSGTFAVEAAINTLVPRDGHVLVLINGAYGTRMAKLTRMMGRKVTEFQTAEDVPTTPQDVDRLLAADRSITHVGLIHCETSTGILNPLAEIAAVVQRHGRSLVVDAMSSFGALPVDAGAWRGLRRGAVPGGDRHDGLRSAASRRWSDGCERGHLRRIGVHGDAWRGAERWQRRCPHRLYQSRHGNRGGLPIRQLRRHPVSLRHLRPH
jgi:hypothetical protein